MVGLDIVYSVGNLTYEEFKREEYAPPLLRRMVAAGSAGSPDEVSTSTTSSAADRGKHVPRRSWIGTCLPANLALPGISPQIGPVPVGNRIRGHARLVSAQPKPAGLECGFGILVELEGSDRPACLVETVVIYR